MTTPITIPASASGLDALSAVASLNSEPSTFIKNSRSSRACDACRRKKIRCSASALEEGPSPTEYGSDQPVKPGCNSCVHSGIPCMFTRIPGKRGPVSNKGYIQQLENRLAALESSANLPSAEDSGSSSSSSSSRGDSRAMLDINAITAALHSKTPRRPVDTSPYISAASAPGMTVLDRGRAAAAPVNGASPIIAPRPRTSLPGMANTAPDFAVPSSSSTSGIAASKPGQTTLPSISKLLNWAPEPTPVVPATRIHRPHANTYSHPDRSEQGMDVDPPRGLGMSAQPVRPTLTVVASGLDTARLGGKDTALSSIPSSFGRASSAISTSSRSPPAGPYPAFGDRRLGAARSKRSHSDVTSSTAPTSVNNSPPTTHLSGFPKGAIDHDLPSLLGRLDLSSVLRLDTPALREAFALSPALQTFALTPAARLEASFFSSPVAIKAAFLLASSSGQTSHDYNVWFSDVRQIVSQCVSPMVFTSTDLQPVHCEIEVLLIAYVDSLRRATPMAGLLELVQGKLAVNPSDRLALARHELAVWHAAAFGGAVPVYSCDVEATKAAASNRVHELVSHATTVLQRILRSKEAQHSVQPLPGSLGRRSSYSLAHWSLEAVLRCFVSVLQIMQEAAQRGASTLEGLEKQLRYLQQVSAEIITSGAAQLLVGPHIVALAACATTFSIVELTSWSQRSMVEEERHRCFGLQRDYVGVLESLKHLTRCLSAPLDSSQQNSQAFASPGDMRPLYHSIAMYIDAQTAAMVQAGLSSIAASEMLKTFRSKGYLGSVLAAAQKRENAV